MSNAGHGTKTLSIRASIFDLSVWKRIATVQGLTFNRWAVNALNDQALLDQALLRERRSIDDQAALDAALLKERRDADSD